MAINTDNIVRYNDIMFNILSNALIKDDNIKEKIIKMNVEEKLQTDKNNLLENTLDIYV